MDVTSLPLQHGTALPMCKEALQKSCPAHARRDFVSVMDAAKRIAAPALLTVLAVPAFAQDAPSLVQDAKNPFADLINLQLFYDANLGVAPANNTQQVLTLQPLVPVHLNSDWIVITRTILPLIE